METVGALLSGRLFSIGPGARVSEASELLARQQVSHLVVLERDRLIGILCACDIDRAAHTSVVGRAMSHRVHTIDADAEPTAALASMREHGVSCLPVMAEGAVRGVITLRDLVRLGLAEQPERCSACGSSEHVRCEHAARPGLCLECTRRSEPPGADEEIGGGG